MHNFSRTTWGQMLSEYRQALGLTKSALARAVGVTVGYISKLEDGKRPPPERQRDNFCEILGLDDAQQLEFHIQAEIERADPTTVKYLLQIAEYKEPLPTENYQRSTFTSSPEMQNDDLTRIPIINKAAAGLPQDFTDLDYPVGIAESYIAVPDITDPNAFGFYVCGDSMTPDFPDKTLLIASPNTVPMDGDPCFVRFSPTSKAEGCTFKRMYLTDDGRIRLVPINRKYAEQTYHRDDITGISPVLRSYYKVNRGPSGGVRSKKIPSGHKSEGISHRASAAG